MDLPRACRF